MLKKADSQPGAIGRPFNQTGHVGDNETAVFADANDAEVRVHGGERVIGNLGAGGGNGTDKGALASIRQAEQADIGKNAQFKAQIAFFAGFAFGALTWRAIDAGFEVNVAEAATTAFGSSIWTD